MKCLLITAALVFFFCQLGSALKCYNCDTDLCKTQEECAPGFDSCIVVHYSGKRVSKCWKFSDCNPQSIEEKLNIATFKYSCCQNELCNSSPIVTGKLSLKEFVDSMQRDDWVRKILHLDINLTKWILEQQKKRKTDIKGKIQYKEK